MIASPSAAFTTAEAALHNQPYFRVVISPHYFNNGVGAGLGTFVDMTFEAPEKLEVNAGAVSASWTSGALTATVGAYPAEAVVSYTLNDPGFVAAVEFRSATTAAGLSGAPWAAVADGATVDLLEYYQWRVTYTGYRCMAEDAEEDADEITAYAVDTEGDDYDSYASDALDGDGGAYLDRMQIAGEFPVAEADILDLGSLSVDCPLEFGQMVAGEHSLTLLNRDGKYSPGHANFIFGEETYWYRKLIDIEMGYETGRGRTAAVRLYRGIILDWGPVVQEREVNGEPGPTVVQVYSRDLVADLGDRKVGKPDADGNPQPLWYGEYLAEARDMNDRTLTSPRKTADFEDGTTNELNSVAEGGSGSADVDIEDPLAGNYQLAFTVAAGSDYARGTLNMVAAAQGVLFTLWVKFAAIPGEPADRNMYFLGLHAAADQFRLYVGPDFKVWAWHTSAGWKETNWLISENDGVWLQVSLALYAAPEGVFRVYVNGGQVLEWEDDWSGSAVYGGAAGLTLGVAAESWELHTDSWRMYNDWQPQAWQVPGGPFDSIGAVYSNGALQIAKPVTRTLRPGYSYQIWSPIGPYGQYYGWGSWVTCYVAARTMTEESLTRYPQYGAVVFSYPAEISGAVLLRLTANGVTHPVDVIEALLGEAGADGYIDAASFAAAKAAAPDDTVGCRFEDVTVTEALQRVGEAALINVVCDHGEIKLIGYNGDPPGSYDLLLTEAEVTQLAPTWSGQNIKNKIAARWGWYERNNRLRYEESDEQSIDFVGELDFELDYTYGSEVASENATMVKGKVGALLTRLRLQTVTAAARASLRAARLELGDVVQVESELLGTAAKYRVYSKKIDMAAPKGVELGLVRFLGEEAA